MTFSLHQRGVVMSSQITHTHNHPTHTPQPIYLTPAPWFSVVTQFWQFIKKKYIYILFRQRGHRDSDMSYKNIITRAKINQIRLWEPLEIETLQPKKDMKYAKEFGYAGHMLPILINYIVIHHTWTYWGIILSMINPIHTTYSPIYPSVETDNMHRYWHWQWEYCWGKLLLCSSSCRQISEHHIYMVSFAHLKCQTLAGVSGDVNKTLECVTI